MATASCETLTRPPPTTLGGTWPYAPGSPTLDGPPQHIVTAARENMSTSMAAPGCLDPLAQGTSARQRCAALGLAGPRLACQPACVRRHLPSEADRANAGGLVAVRYTLDAQGRFERAASLHDPGCGLGRAAVDALRVCCAPVEDGAAPRGAVEGCHVVEFTSAR